jgi:aspartyl-tRNA(Asn)/glutamyl-tRNA(Gln) amidotransferase subunit B
MPELPAAKRRRFVENYGIPEYDAQVLTLTAAAATYFEEVARVSGEGKLASNWVMGELAGALKGRNLDIAESPVPAARLAELVKLVASGEISGKLAKDVFAKMFESGRPASEIIAAEGLQQISDTSALEKIADEILAANAKQVEQYRAGKKGVLGFFVGQMMKATRGQANPAVVNEVLTRKLG